MDLRKAADAIYAFRFGPPGAPAYRGALLLAAIALSHLPELPQVILDEIDEDG